MTEQQIEELIGNLYENAARQMRDGEPDEKIKHHLVDLGLAAESAAMVVGNLAEMRREARQKQGRKNMLFGALWCLGGLAVTALTYSAASTGGGHFIVAWGAMVFGGVQFLQGAHQYVRAG